MLDLMKARLIKYFRSPLFYIAAIVSLASGIYGGVYCTFFKNETDTVINCRADDMWMLTAIWAGIILVSMCAGREFSDGTIRNKIAVGHTKTVVFLAEVIVAVIMTGMGCDGCEGMKKIKAAGGYSIAQDEPTCVVYGMPKAVVDAGLADEIKPIQSIAQAIVEAVKR